jgi:serine/threonine-protein kinase
MVGSDSLNTETQSLNQTVAMTQRISRHDFDETEVLDPKSTVFDGLEPTAAMPTIEDDGGDDDHDDTDNARNQPIQPPITAKKKRRGAAIGWVSALILALIVGGGASAWWWATGPGASTTVPDVSGSSIVEASAALTTAELIVSPTVLEEFDLVLPAGQVKGTAPAAGEVLDKESEVTLIVSLGPNPVNVPPLTGASLSEASQVLESLNLILGVAREEFSDTIDAGLILRLTDTAGQTVPPNTEVLAGSTLDSVISAGRVPDVAGLSVDEARDLLQGVGLVGVVGGDGAFSDTIAEGFVVEILGITTRTVAPGDTLTLLVSRGPELVTIPEVVGDTIAEAKSALEALGFRVEVRSEYPESEWGRSFARVTSVDPSAGQSVAKGTTVVLRSFV